MRRRERPPDRWSLHVDRRPIAAAPIPTGLRGRCPRCGEGHLFKGFLTLAPVLRGLRPRLRDASIPPTARPSS